VPEIFTSADGRALVMNYVKGGSEQIIPIGLKTEWVGETRLTISGMAHYDADRIEFVDVSNKKTTDISQREQFEFAFNNRKQGVSEGQFYLRIFQSATGIGFLPNKDNLQLVRSEEGINVISSPNNKIRHVFVYDVRGRLLFNSTPVNGDMYAIPKQFEEKVLIVRVMTENEVRSIKLIN
jgi:hypothetical protein